MANKIQVNLTLAPDADLERVAHAASALGLNVDQKLEELGVISGEVDESQIEALRGLPEVVALERSRAIKLPPSGSPIQ